jgi:hypothetical protein
MRKDISVQEKTSIHSCDRREQNPFGGISIPSQGFMCDPAQKVLSDLEDVVASGWVRTRDESRREGPRKEDVKSGHLYAFVVAFRVQPGTGMRR